MRFSRSESASLCSKGEDRAGNQQRPWDLPPHLPNMRLSRSASASLANCFSGFSAEGSSVTEPPPETKGGTGHLRVWCVSGEVGCGRSCGQSCGRISILRSVGLAGESEGGFSVAEPPPAIKTEIPSGVARQAPRVV